MILGNMERARDLLDRATEVDPTSADLAYRYGRVLEELGDRPGAIAQFCRVLALESDLPGLEDAGTRLQSLAEADRVEIPDAAVAEFQRGLSLVDEGEMEEAVEAFGLAYEHAPDWADPLYNRGVVQATLGLRALAIADLQEYLALRPNALDAIAVSQRIGQLESPGRLPNPSAALVLGVIPGMGHFYSGRGLGGLTVLGLAGGAVAAGLLIEEVTVQCLDVVQSGQACPPDRILGETTDQPYKTAALGVAAAVTAIGAVEAFIKARRVRAEGRIEDAGEDEGPGGLALGPARVLGPSVTARGKRLDLSLVRVFF
jgi:tetratricopeptide (TPR) repeat protein